MLLDFNQVSSRAGFHIQHYWCFRWKFFFFFGGARGVICPAHSRVFSCIPGLYPLDSSSTPTPQELRRRNLSPNLAKHPSKAKPAPVESHWPRWSRKVLRWTDHYQVFTHSLVHPELRAAWLLQSSRFLSLAIAELSLIRRLYSESSTHCVCWHHMPGFRTPGQLQPSGTNCPCCFSLFDTFLKRLCWLFSSSTSFHGLRSHPGSWPVSTRIYEKLSLLFRTKRAETAWRPSHTATCGQRWATDMSSEGPGPEMFCLPQRRHIVQIYLLPFSPKSPWKLQRREFFISASRRTGSKQ